MFKPKVSIFVKVWVVLVMVVIVIGKWIIFIVCLHGCLDMYCIRFLCDNVVSHICEQFCKKKTTKLNI